jgi:threonine dehydratase
VANSYANEHGLLWIEDGAHAAIAEGAGTIALEAFENNDSVEILLAPMGNGALVAGLGCYAKYRLPFAATIAVASAGAPAMARSVRQGVICTTERVHTIADGIAVRIPIPAAVHAVRNVVDDVVLVDDDDIRRAMQLVEQQLGILAEPAGAAGFAALVAEPERWRGKTIFIALCGGNV